jgi:hypothetical protein
LYFLAPNIKQRFLATLPGAILAVGCWLAPSYLLGLYFRHFANFNKTYGTLGAGIALMTWLYWTGFAILVQVVFFDDGVRPHRLHERVFSHELAGILHQDAKSVEQLAPQADFLVVTKEPSLVHIKDEVAKEVLGHNQTAAGIGGCTGKPDIPTCSLFYQWNKREP